MDWEADEWEAAPRDGACVSVCGRGLVYGSGDEAVGSAGVIDGGAVGCGSDDGSRNHANEACGGGGSSGVEAGMNWCNAWRRV